MQIPAPNQDDSELKMYVLINRDILTLVQCGVQAAHSIHTYCFDYPEKCKTWNDKHKTLIFLEAKESEIYEKINDFVMIGKTFSFFNEPDLGNVLTACCFEPLMSEEGKEIFGKFKLLS